MNKMQNIKIQDAKYFALKEWLEQNNYSFPVEDRLLSDITNMLSCRVQEYDKIAAKLVSVEGRAYLAQAMGLSPRAFSRRVRSGRIKLEDIFIKMNLLK